MRRFFPWWSIIFSLSLLLACQAQTEDSTIIAKIGNDQITFESLDPSFFQSLEIYEDSALENQVALTYLDSLVNQRLLIRAAYEGGLDQDREINILVDEQKPRFKIDELYRMLILEKSEPAERELKDYYQKSGEQRKLRHILVKEKSQANEIYKQLQKGGDFEQLAKENSTDPGSKDFGGDLGWVSWGSMAEPFQQAAWKLRPGGLSKPVQTNFGWHIIKLEEIKKIEQRPYEEVADFLKQRLKTTKQAQLSQEFLDQLRTKAKIKMDSSTYQLLVERDSLERKKDLLNPPRPRGSYLKPDLFSETERNLPLLEYKGGEITLGEFLELLARVPVYQRGNFDDPSRVEQLAFQMATGDLLEKEAEKKGVESRPGYKENILKLKEALMADKMRNDYIMLNVKVNDEDLHNYYDTHLEQFQIPENVKIQEVLVASEAEAKRLAQQLKAGADFVKIVQQHTLRPGVKEKGGILDSITLARSEPLFNAVRTAKKGQIVGPAPFKDKFSVIKLLERRPMKQFTYEEALPQLRMLAYEEKKQSVFKNWVEARKQRDQVEVYSDLFITQVFDELARLQTQRPPGQTKKIKGQFPLKIKIGPEGQIEKVEDE